MVFHNISHNRTADTVIEQIERLILQGVLRPGTRLPAERELAKKLDVSRPILRDALKELEERGLLASRHGEGTFVADVIGTVFSEPVVNLIRRHPPAVADYLEFRREIEATTAAMAAKRATEADREILTRLFAAMQAAHEEGDFAEEAALDVEFHHAIGESAHNIVLLHTLRACYQLLSDGVFYSREYLYKYPHSRDRLLEQHRGIYEAVMAGDAEKASEAAAGHISYVESIMREVQRASQWHEVAEMRLQQFSETDRAIAGSPRRRTPKSPAARKTAAGTKPKRTPPAGGRKSKEKAIQ